MSETPTEQPEQPTRHAWLPPADVHTWLQVGTDDADQVAAVERVRVAAAAYCERQRPDLVVVDVGAGTATFTAPETVLQAGLLCAARLWARRATPTGLASFGEFGASDILRYDPDLDRLLGVGRYAAPRVG